MVGSPVPAVEVPDTLAQRVQACTGCHGKEGRAAPDGYYPRIAGKPAGYLYAQLLNFRDGRRHFGPMAALLDPLSDAYLWEIAEHFAGLKVPYPPPTVSASGASMGRGRTLAEKGDPSRQIPACRECHGRSLTGLPPAIPALLGLPRDYLNAQLGAWRAGQRRATAPDCMADVARRLSPEDIGAVSAYLASVPFPSDAASEPAPARLPLDCGSPSPPGSNRARQAGEGASRQ